MKLVALSNAKNRLSEQLKVFEEGKTSVDAEFGDKEHIVGLLQSLNSYKQANLSRGGSVSWETEPILLVPTTTIQKNLEYEHLKYSNKRDPTLDEIKSSCQSCEPALDKVVAPLGN